MTAWACLAATAVLALRPTPSVLRAPLDRVRRSGRLVAQAGWVPLVDEASGSTYYYCEHTGESSWDPPPTAQQGYGAQVSWRMVPESGAYSPLRRGGLGALKNGEEQTLSRYDMVEQSPYVSREQCIVAVGSDGTATLTSLGKPPTFVREHESAEWFGLRKGETHILADGQQIALAGELPWTPWSSQAVYTCRCQVKGGGGGDDVQYSDDGWMWNGAEWIPAPQ